MDTRTSDSSRAGECIINPNMSLGIRASSSFYFIDIVQAAREARCESRVLRELFRNRLNYLQNYHVASRCSGVPRRRIARALRTTAGSRVGIRAAEGACCPAAFDTFGQGFLRVIFWNPGYCAYPGFLNRIIQVGRWNIHKFVWLGWVWTNTLPNSEARACAFCYRIM